MSEHSVSRSVIVFIVAVAALATSGCFSSFVDHAENQLSIPAPVDDQDQLPAYIKQCEAVLGPIPEIDCDPAHPSPGTIVTKIPVFVGGQLLAFDPKNISAAEQTLLDQRAASGSYTCDFPTLGGLFSCGVGSTLVQYQSPDNPNVQWVGLCRGVNRDNPSYDRFIGDGLIGANVKTGEMCFFFNLNPTPEAPYKLPHLTSAAKSNEELAPWLPATKMPGSCISCHPNNDPWILTPWLQPSYMREYLTSNKYPLKMPSTVSIDDVLAARTIETTPMDIQNMLPTPLPPGRTGFTEEEIINPHGGVALRQYRIVGSSYVQNESDGGPNPRTGVKPDTWSIPFRQRVGLKPIESSCSAGCHAMGNEHWIHLAHDALGTHYSQYVSPQMMSGSIAGNDWMPTNLAGASDIDDPSAFSVPAITECPLPKQIPGDVSVQCSVGKSVTVSWTYVNDYGNVPGRDDIRFDVATLSDGAAANGLGVSPASAVEGEIMNAVSGATVLRDLAPTDGATYTLHVPLGEQRPQKVLLQPKRYCFEEPGRRPYAYAPPKVIDIAKACP